MFDVNPCNVDVRFGSHSLKQCKINEIHTINYVLRLMIAGVPLLKHTAGAMIKTNSLLQVFIWEIL